MASIVFIHGMNHQYQSELELQQRYWQALASGCLAATRKSPELYDKIPDASDTTLAYYGDLFRDPPRVPGAVKPASNDFGDEDDPLTPGELELASSWAGAPVNETLNANELEPAAPDYAALDRLAIGTRPAAARPVERRTIAWFTALQEICGDGPVARKIAKTKIKHLYRYVNDPDRAELVLARVRLSEDTKLVIGHSMGSIVAYELLRRKQPVNHTLQLLTLGSPLAMPYVLRNQRIGGSPNAFPSLPERVSRWVNVSDPRDPVVTTTQLASYFDHAGLELIDDVSVNNGAQPHAIERYLNAAETGRVVLDALYKS